MKKSTNGNAKRDQGHHGDFKKSDHWILLF